jgi:hypothetical protein
MVDMKNTVQRAFLTLLLLLILIGMAGHWVNTAKITAHASSESVCVIHAGIVLPEQPKPSQNEPNVALLPTPDQTIPWCLRENISHPPTM